MSNIHAISVIYVIQNVFCYFAKWSSTIVYIKAMLYIYISVDRGTQKLQSALLVLAHV